MSVERNATVLAELIKRSRLDLSSEKATQADIETLLKDNGWDFERECRIGPGDIPDFMIDGIAVEVKLRSSRRKQIVRQLARYAEYERVKALLLVSNTSIVLPADIAGKPVQFVSLGAAWL